MGERVDRILERVDRILQDSLGQGRVRRTCRPGSRRRAARRKQVAQCSFPKELNRPSRTNSHHRARAGENTTDPRNQPRVASEKEAQHRRRSSQSRSWTPHQPKARRAPERARQISLHIERLAALRKRWRRLSRARRLAPAAWASWATAAAAPPGGGARPCASRRASQSSSELDAASAEQGASEAGAEGAEGPGAPPGGGGATEAAWKAKPLGHQSGEPPWAAAAGAQSRRGNQELRGRETRTTTRQGTQARHTGRRQAGSQAQDEGPQAEG